MFFMIGCNSSEKELEYHGNFICPVCGMGTGCRVIMTCMVLSLFFIPVFRWNRTYTLVTNCCHGSFRLSASAGRRIERDPDASIDPSDLEFISGASYSRNRSRVCPNCGFTTDEDYTFCPKCSMRLK